MVIVAVRVAYELDADRVTQPRTVKQTTTSTTTNVKRVFETVDEQQMLILILTALPKRGKKMRREKSDKDALLDVEGLRRRVQEMDV
jgi:hypothetical protein